MTPEQQKQIISQESAWVDQSFGQLDLSAFPALQPHPPETSRDDGRFARAYGDTALKRSAQDLRDFVSNPDLDAMQETGSEMLLRDVRDQRAEKVVLEFKRANPEYLPTQANYEAITATLSFNALPESDQHGDSDDIVDRLIAGGYWTIGNLEACYRELNRQGLLDVPAGEPRNLSERERLRVSRMAQAGRIEEAIGEYLRCSLDGDEPTLELVNDPKYRGLCDDAVYTVWEETQLDFVPTGSRKAYLLRFAGNRPLTIPLLREAWKSCMASERRSERGQLLNSIEQQQQTPPTPAEIDNLKDDEVERLYHQSLKAYAETFKRAPGVIT